MKKALLLFMLPFVSSLMFGQSSIYVKGQDRVVDTLEHKQIGPGIIYTKASIPSIPITFYTLSVDMNNEYGRIETFQAQNETGKTENMTSAYNRLTTSTQKSLAAINGNFWIVASQGLDPRITGVPHSVSARNGEMVTADENSWNRGHGALGIVVVDENNKVWVDDMKFDGYASIEGVGNFDISQTNRVRGNDQLVFYNNYTTTTRTAGANDGSGIEVFIKPVSGQVWSINREVECEVVNIIKDKGGNAIPAGQSVLSGVGTARTFLENLVIGGKVKVRQGVYTVADNLRPMVTQMLAGNALVMKDGVLTERNTNEAYNTTLYPRTGIGVSSDKEKVTLIVVDKLGTSIGVSTETLCEILKASGSVDASSLDGGGSAQMMLGGAIVNSPADGRERAVANGWMLFSTAPQNDTKVTEIKFEDYSVKVPKLASYKPVILGYNKYGELISENVEGVKLSCDPSLGSISNDGSTFAAKAGSGLLTADFNGTKVTKQVSVVESDILMRVDSLVIDNNLKYPIEVYSLVGTAPFYYDPASISWEVADPSICAVDDGILKGLNKGVTYVKGTLGDFKDSIKVKVEIPAAHSVLFDDDYSSDWTLDAVPSITNKALEKTDTGVKYKFTYKTERSPFVEMKRPAPLYALPDSLHFTIKTDIPLSSTVVYLMPSNSRTFSSFQIPALAIGGEYEARIPFDEYFDLTDISVFPIKLSSLYFNIGKGVVNGQDYTIEIKNFSLIYNYLKGSSLEENEVDSDLLSIYPNPVVDGSLYLNIGNVEADIVNVEVYSISGQLLQNEALQNTGEVLLLDVQKLKAGVYLLKVDYNETKKIARFIVQ